jgi:hypothetical protein
MKQTNFQKITEYLGAILRCPLCAEPYPKEDTFVIETREGELLQPASMLLHSECGKCKSSVVFSISIRGEEILSVGMVTDLTRADAARIKDLPPIDADYVLAMHMFLGQFDGDFVGLFQQRAI